MQTSGALIVLLGALMALRAAMGGAFIVLLWPALAFVVVGLSYLVGSPRCFGKRSHGGMRMANRIVLMPYLGVAHGTWHLVRALSREAPYDQLLDTVWIGRRLLASEATPPADVLVDLTCEFAESPRLRKQFREYVAIPILDKGIPDSPAAVIEHAARFVGQHRRIYVHCAQGHGRTGMFAAVLLLANEPSLSAEDAIERVRRARPGVALSRQQTAFVRDARGLLSSQSVL